MNKKYILYNSRAGNGECKKEAELLANTFDNAELIEVQGITSYRAFFAELDESDEVILCGGDGTLNRFVNDVQGFEIKNSIYYYAIGSGNDFARDIGKEKGSDPTYKINRYIMNLPTVTVNGESHLFLNGIGFGIDGYCCEVGERVREKGRQVGKKKPINYTKIAIKGLLFHYKPVNATVAVDGEQHTFRKVWLAPTMNGRYYGGGMMPTPKQDRLGKENEVTVMVMYGTGKLSSLLIFPSIFKGTHIRHTKFVAVLSGHHITVTFDCPTPLQIDGETIANVTEYAVTKTEWERKAEQRQCVAMGQR